MRAIHGDEDEPGFASAALVYYENWKFQSIDPNFYELDSAIALEIIEIIGIAGGLGGRKR